MCHEICPETQDYGNWLIWHPKLAENMWHFDARQSQQKWNVIDWLKLCPTFQVCLQNDFPSRHYRHTALHLFYPPLVLQIFEQNSLHSTQYFWLSLVHASKPKYGFSHRHSRPASYGTRTSARKSRRCFSAGREIDNIQPTHRSVFVLLRNTLSSPSLN